MGDIYVAPVLFEIFRHKAAVALVRLVLAAQQAAVCDNFFGNRLLDAPLFHQL
jgi:hypothetical protein